MAGEKILITALGPDVEQGIPRFVELVDQAFGDGADVPNIVAWGKVPAGAVLDGHTLREVLERQVEPSLSPAFTAFTVSSLTETVMEVGAPVPANGIVSWHIFNAGKALPDTVTLTDHRGTVLFSGMGLDASPQAITCAGWTHTTPGTTTWTLAAQDRHGGTFRRECRVAWLPRLYFGESEQSSLDAAAVQALRVGCLKGSRAGSYAFQPGGYKWLAVPRHLGKPSSCRDVSNGLPVPMDDMGTVALTNAYGVTHEYYLFRSSHALGGAISIAVA